MTPKIALEEHVLVPGLVDYWGVTVENVPKAAAARIKAQLEDFGTERLESMEKAGIVHAVLSAAGPGVQAETDAKVATRVATAANDFLAREVAKRPDRYSGFAHLAMQDAHGAADELERCVRDLGFRGAMINGHTGGCYLDDPSLYVFWERVEALGCPIYLHPADPVSLYPALAGHPGLRRATWEWTMETGTHALRLVFSGTFDRFPKAQLILGHLGETLPYLLGRFDSRAKLYGVELAKPPSASIRENIAVTNSGMFSREPLICALDALGADRVMFSADYPFEDPQEAAAFIDSVPLDEAQRRAICFGTAQKMLGLPVSDGD